jgi:hypothetical protein
MKPAIKCILTETYTLKTTQDIGYDEEQEIIGFSMEDLSQFTDAIIRECADTALDSDSRKLILTHLGT